MHISDMKRKKVASIPFSLSNLTIVGWDDEAILYRLSYQTELRSWVLLKFSINVPCSHIHLILNILSGREVNSVTLQIDDGIW